MTQTTPQNTPQITPEIVEQHGLSSEEYDRVLNALGREPNLVELGIFSVMWSEHCSYKSSRLHLKKLPTEAPWVICGPGENAGVIAEFLANSEGWTLEFDRSWPISDDGDGFYLAHLRKPA